MEDKKEPDFLKEDFKRGVGSGGSKLKINSVSKDYDNNTVFKLEHEGKTYLLNVERRSSWLPNTDEFFKYAYRTFDIDKKHDSKNLLAEVCENWGGLNYRCQEKRDRHDDYDRDDRDHGNTTIGIGGLKFSWGGGESYNYITNPLTNRRVKLTGRLGKQVLQNYINSLNN